MRRSIILVAVLIGMLVLAGCAPGPNSAEKTPDADGRTQIPAIEPRTGLRA